MTRYIGPERRTQDRRNPLAGSTVGPAGRRNRAERRQAAHASILVGFSAEDMDKLIQLWQLHERTQRFNREHTRV